MRIKRIASLASLILTGLLLVQCNDHDVGSGSQGVINSPLFAYIGDNNGTLQRCSVSGGTFTNCAAIPSTGAPAWDPSSVAYATVNSNNYAYIADPNGHMYVCSMADGTVSGCVPTPTSNAPSWQPTGVTIATVNGTQYAFVGVQNNDTIVYSCSLNNDGSFNTCGTSNNKWHPSGATVATVNGVQYMYVADHDGAELVCNVESDGTANIGTCTPTPASPPTWVPISTTFATINNVQYAYVANQNGSVFQCTLQSDGTFNVCNATPSSNPPSWGPFQITIQQVNGTNYAYGTDWNGGDIQACTINPDGSFGTCATAFSDVNTAPWGLFFAAF